MSAPTLRGPGREAATPAGSPPADAGRLAPRILCVHYSPPADWSGTPVVLHRHLSRFEAEGWTVGYAASEHKLALWPGAPARWASFPLPMRRWWWPPHRAGIPGIAALRRWLTGTDLARRAQGWEPDVVLAVLSPYDVHLADAVARRCRCPLVVLLHDQPELWEDYKDDPEARARVRTDIDAALRFADRVYPVTDALAAAYGPGVVAKSQRLLPIPPDVRTAPARWRDAYARPHVVLSGSLHPFQRPTVDALARALASIGGRLTAITQNDHGPFEGLVREHPNLTLLPAFPTSADARAFMAEHASALLVSYAFEGQPWGPTSFPSKLLEGVQLGLPVWVVGPPDAAASAWARSAGWTAHTETLAPDALTAEVKALATPDGWERRAADSRRAAAGEFDPATIHDGLAADLAQLLSTGLRARL